MANVEINDLTNKATGASTDEFEIQETGGGSSRKMPMSGVRITRSQVTDFPAAYGAIYEETASPGTSIAMASAGTYYGWVSASSGELDGTYVSADVADGTADHLTIESSGDGVYHITLSVSFSGTGNSTFTGKVFNSGVATTVGFSRKLGTGGDVGSAGCSGLLDLSNGDELSVRFTSDSGSDTLNVWFCQLSIVRI